MTDYDDDPSMAHELALDYELRRRKRMDADCGYYAEDEEMDSLIEGINQTYGKEHDEEKETKEPDYGCVNLKIKKVKNGFIISTHLDCNTEEIWIAVTTYDIAAICRELAERL